jgi:tetratricopeptide (TPR) repeat protein
MKILILISICLSTGERLSEPGQVINMLRAEKAQEYKIVPVYLREVKNLMRCDNFEGALRTLDKALTEHPLNALLLSYYGYLDATVNKNYERGIGFCKTAINIIEEESREAESLRHKGSHAVLYLHLGRTYLAGGIKKSAVKAFKRGLEADPEDPYLLSEVRRAGIRRKRIFHFLKRSNPINKYIGMLLHNK